MLGGMQFRVLVEVLFCEIDGRVPKTRSLACWWKCRFARLTAARLTAGCWGHVAWGAGCYGEGVLVEVLFGELDGRVLAVLRA